MNTEMVSLWNITLASFPWGTAAVHGVGKHGKVILLEQNFGEIFFRVDYWAN